MASQGKVAVVDGRRQRHCRSAALALQGDVGTWWFRRRKEELDKTVALAKPGAAR